MAAIDLALGILAFQDPDPHLWAGIDGFVLLLRASNVRLHEPGDRLERPKRVCVFLLGESPKREDLATVRKLVNSGSALVIASDRPSMQPVFREYDDSPIMGFEAGPFRAARPEDSFEGYADCPLVTPDPSLADHPLFQDVKRIAFNRAAAFPGSTYYDLARLPPDESGIRRVCMRSSDSGRALFISDHSPFINVMLVEESNAAFARNVIKCAGCTDALLFYDGRPITESMLPENLRSLRRFSTRQLNPALRRIEESGKLRQIGRKLFPFGFAAATLLLFAALLVGFSRLPPGAAPDLSLQGTLLRDFAPAPGPPDLSWIARDMISSWWKSRGLSEDVRRIRLAGPWHRRWLGVRRLRRLARWRVRPPVGVSPAALERIRRSLAALDTLIP